MRNNRKNIEAFYFGKKREDYRVEEEKRVEETGGKTLNALRVTGISDFDLSHTFECGQCFRWNREEDGSYTGVACGRAVNLQLDGGTLFIENSTREEFEGFWYDYLDLGRDYGAVKKRLSGEDETMSRAVAFGNGIRLLRQDPWETVVSFLISQNSNIARIRRCIDLLCRSFGKPIGFYRGEERFSFPQPESLAVLEPEDLSECRLGYRDKYVIQAARAVAEDGGAALLSMREKGCEEALDYVRSLYGVGPKVADCILLFGLAKYGSFPLDVWMKRVMSQLYGFDPKDVKGMKAHAEKRFGDLGGFAQQYLFYYAKENL